MMMEYVKAKIDYVVRTAIGISGNIAFVEVEISPINKKFIVYLFCKGGSRYFPVNTVEGYWDRGVEAFNVALDKVDKLFSECNKLNHRVEK